MFTALSLALTLGPALVQGTLPLQRTAEAPDELDLHVSGFPLEGQPLALEVRGPSATNFFARVELRHGGATSVAAPAGAIPLARAPRTSRRELPTLQRSIRGTTDANGLWRMSFDAPEAGSEILIRAYASGREFEALELTILEPYAALPGDVSVTMMPTDDAGRTFVRLVNHTDFVLALGDWTLADEHGAIEVLAPDLHLPARGTTLVATDALRDSLALVSGDGQEMDRVGLTSPGVSFGATPIGSPVQGVTKCGMHEDVPDLDFEDTNCDGIDGDITRAVFVSTTGSPLNPGTPQAPLDSVNAAILLAASDPGKDHVYVSEGVYVGLVTLADGVSVWGGYSQANGWQRSGAFVTGFFLGGNVAGNQVGVHGANLASATLGSVLVTTNTAPSNGHNYGILLQNSNDVTLEAVTVLAGNGGTASGGAPGVGGSAGASGSNGIATSGAPGGGGANGGGNGGNSASNGSIGGGSGGGSGGVAGVTGNNGGVGSNGGAGATGSAGAIGSNVGTAVAGLWLSNGDGSAGGMGAAGSGGGGGGGGGLAPLFAFPGGGGGGGGGGGFGATGGTGGRAGGSSFAIFLSSSDATIQGCSLTAGPGRNGGSGGNGGAGGFGGFGGSGAFSGVTTGGSGGSGGNGGNGGMGGGGGGGNSYAIVVDALSSLSLSGSTLSTSLPGAGGFGGNIGFSGQTALVKQL